MDEIGRLRKTETAERGEKTPSAPEEAAPVLSAMARTLSVGLRTPPDSEQEERPEGDEGARPGPQEARVDPVNGLPPDPSPSPPPPPATTVTVASSASLTDSPRTSEPAAVPTFVMGEEPRVISAVSSIVWPTPSDAMSPMCPIVSSSTEIRTGPCHRCSSPRRCRRSSSRPDPRSELAVLTRAMPGWITSMSCASVSETVPPS